jgi:hypothetical protein
MCQVTRQKTPHLVPITKAQRKLGKESVKGRPNLCNVYIGMLFQQAEQPTTIAGYLCKDVRNCADEANDTLFHFDLTLTQRTVQAEKSSGFAVTTFVKRSISASVAMLASKNSCELKKRRRNAKPR